jgi:CRISPR-associated protein (TIGR02584 family)
MHPGETPLTRRILVITTGASPQLVTETLWALLRRSPSWVPDRVVIATTHAGHEMHRGISQRRPSLPIEERVRDLFVQEGRPESVPPIEYLIPRLRDGAPISDLRSPDEVAAFAELLFSRVRALTDDDDVELHLSIAGGRKTMSAVASQVMTLCGRPRDTMSHSLVEPASLEGRDYFWWPGNDGRTDLGDARVDLHELPYIRLRAWLDLDSRFRELPDSFADAVDRTNRALAAEEVTVDFREASLDVGRQSVDFQNSRDFVAIASILVARRLHLTLRKTKRLAEERGAVATLHIEANGDADRFARLYATCAALLRLNRIYDGHPEMIAVNTRRFDDLVRERARDFTYEDLNVGLSHAKRRLRERLEPALANRLLWSERRKLAQTGFASEDININLPADVPDDIFQRI